MVASPVERPSESLKGPDGTPILIESIVRPPVVLDFTDSGRVILEFPTQHPTSTHDPICTSLVDGTYTITFPPSSVLTIPSGNIEPTVNGQRIQLSTPVRKYGDVLSVA